MLIPSCARLQVIREPGLHIRQQEADLARRAKAYKAQRAAKLAREQAAAQLARKASLARAKEAARERVSLRDRVKYGSFVCGCATCC